MWFWYILTVIPRDGIANFAGGNYTVFMVQAYQTSQYVVPCGSIFLGKWCSSFAGSSDSKINVQSACALNTRYNPAICNTFLGYFV
jgi:hypothetical protein